MWTLLAVLLSAAVTAQIPVPDRSDTDLRRFDTRIQSLRAEGDRLAASARTLLGELRGLEIERDLRAAEAARATAALADAETAVQDTVRTVAGLEEERDAQLPALRAQLVRLYKHGRAGYGEMLVAGGDARELGRAIRAVGALTELSHRRLEEHRHTLESLQETRSELDARRAALERREREAQTARAAAQRAVRAHAARIADVDARRDLAARYVGELEVARSQLLAQLEARDATAAPVAVPLRPFRGALAWPVDGLLTGRFGESSSRLGGTAIRNGIEISAPLDAPVRAVHEGAVAHAGPFTGFGTLVILDHGGDSFSLYGYLSDLSVKAGDAVGSGAELGHVGNAPAGPPALYFELRIDGRAVDPVQWLESR